MGVPKMDGLQWKILLKWMIRGTPTLGNLHNSMMCGFVQIAISGGVCGWDYMRQDLVCPRHWEPHCLPSD